MGRARSAAAALFVALALCALEWRGAQCAEDVDECAEELVSCGLGQCKNLPGGYTCECSTGFCGDECALTDPCVDSDGDGRLAEPEAGAAMVRDRHGPCLNGARCEQRCAAEVDYECHCVNGWDGKNCSVQAVTAEAGTGGGTAARWALGVGGALLALALGGTSVAVLWTQARRKRATRGTYSPSGQEYCNPRAEMITHALKPPPEERLI